MDFRILIATGCLVFATGCAHPFKIKNLDDFRVSQSSLASSVPVSLGLEITAVDPEERRYADKLVRGLRKSRSLARIGAAGRRVDLYDYVAHIDLKVEHSGSLANFFVSFPGFLVWAPAWHGFVYGETIVARIDISDGETGQVLDSVTERVSLDLRHSEIDRTWIELSWLELGVLAFAGGIYNTTFDDDIKGKASMRAGQVVGNYLASRIVDLVGSRHLADARESEEQRSYAALQSPESHRRLAAD